MDYYWHINYENLRKQLKDDIDSIFKELPDKLPQINGYVIDNSMKVCNLSSIKDSYLLKYHIINKVEKLELTNEDILANPLVMPFDIKFRNLETGVIDFDDGTDIFKTLNDAKQRLKTFISKNLELYNEKIGIYHTLPKEQQ